MINRFNETYKYDYAAIKVTDSELAQKAENKLLADGWEYMGLARIPYSELHVLYFRKLK